jgi:hypothetical protein
MNECFVAGGIYKNLRDEEYFALVCPSPGDLPCLMLDGMMAYFRLMWQNAHLYRVEEDYTLTLVAPSTEALQWGVKAPERVWPAEDLLIKLRAVKKQAFPQIL